MVGLVVTVVSIDPVVPVIDDYPGGWFGESWYAPVCESARHRPTPVGDICPQCGKAIEVGDQGVLIPLISSSAKLLSWHLDCFLASVLPRARAYDFTKETGADG